DPSFVNGGTVRSRRVGSDRLLAFRWTRPVRRGGGRCRKSGGCATCLPPAPITATWTSAAVPRFRRAHVRESPLGGVRFRWGRSVRARPSELNGAEFTQSCGMGTERRERNHSYHLDGLSIRPKAERGDSSRISLSPPRPA